MKRKELKDFQKQILARVDKTPPFKSLKAKPRGKFEYLVIHRSSLHGNVIEASVVQTKKRAKEHFKYLLDFEMSVKRSFHLQLVRCEVEAWCHYEKDTDVQVPKGGA